MATVVIMPKQGQSVESCIITEWNKKKGEKVLRVKSYSLTKPIKPHLKKKLR